MSAYFRCLFLMFVLFADLTDDVCAVLLPAETPICSWTNEDTPLLLAFRYRRELDDQIASSLDSWTCLGAVPGAYSCGLSSPYEGAVQSNQGWDDCLYVFMSLQC